MDFNAEILPKSNRKCFKSVLKLETWKLDWREFCLLMQNLLVSHGTWLIFHRLIRKPKSLNCHLIPVKAKKITLIDSLSNPPPICPHFSKCFQWAFYQNNALDECKELRKHFYLLCH